MTFFVVKFQISIFFIPPQRKCHSSYFMWYSPQPLILLYLCLTCNYAFQVLVDSRHRRSLSEGATLLSGPATTAHQLGCEECKLTCPSEGEDSNGGSSCGSGSQGQCLSHTPPRERLRSNSDLQCSGDGMGAYDGRKPASPPITVRALSMPGKEGSGVVGLAFPRQKRGGTQEKKGCEGEAGGESLSPPPCTWHSSSPSSGISKGFGRRRPRVSLASWEKQEVSLGSGSVGGAGLSDGGSVLPPCPVCFDRLDPSVVGVPVARVRSQVARARFSHLDYVVKPNGYANIAGNETDADGKRKDKDGGVPSKEGCLAEDAGKGGRGWKKHIGGALEGRGRPALNLVMWKGSECRVCHSLNVALEGAQDTVRL